MSPAFVPSARRCAFTQVASRPSGTDDPSQRPAQCPVESVFALLLRQFLSAGVVSRTARFMFRKRRMNTGLDDKITSRPSMTLEFPVHCPAIYIGFQLPP